jgi:hypothetical protein
MRGMAIVCPFSPTDIHFLHEESSLCQLQSRFRGRLSVVAPAIRDDFFVSGKNSGELIQLIHRRAKCARDVTIGERFSAACVEKNKIEFIVLDSVQDGRPGFFGAKLVSEVLHVRANLSFRKCHMPPVVF